MAHYALVNAKGIVEQVIVAEQDVIDSGVFGSPGSWVQTSYNTSGGQHKLGGTPLRKNYAGIGYKYDAELDAFIPPKPFQSWVLNVNTCLWDAPVAMPMDGKRYTWDESQLNWVEVVIPEAPVEVTPVEVTPVVEEVVAPAEVAVEVSVAEVTIDVGTASATPTI